MSWRRYVRIIQSIFKQKQPIKFAVGLTLRLTGPCRLFTIDRGLYQLRFYPTALSHMLWVYPNDRRRDEQLIAEYLRSGDIVVDIGANIGTITLTAASVVGRGGRVISVEPHPLIFRYLMSNIKFNNFTNVIAFNFAAGKIEKAISFSNKHSDDQNKINDSEDLEVRVVRLDSLLDEDTDSINLLKIDVEGYEKFVLIGMGTVLDSVDCIYFESSDEHFSNYHYQSRDIFELLEKAGFLIYHVNIWKREFSPIEPDYTSARRTNLLALRQADVFIERTGYELGEGSL